MDIQIILNALQAVVAFFLIQFYLKNSKLEDKINSHDSTIKVLESKQTQLENKVDKLMGHETDIQLLKSNQTQLESKVDKLMGLMEDIGKDIKDISIALAKKKDLDK